MWYARGKSTTILPTTTPRESALHGWIVKRMCVFANLESTTKKAKKEEKRRGGVNRRSIHRRS